MADDAPQTPGSLIDQALPGILGRARVVVTPYPFGVSDADFLRVIVLNSVPGVVVNIHGRVAAPGVEAKPFAFELAASSSRMPTTQDFVLGGGFVTNLSVFASGAAPQIGQTFVIVQLVRSAGATAFIMGTLLQGYVTTTQNVGWPGSPIQSSIDGGGAYRQIVGTVPAPGVHVVEVVPSGARWELLAVEAQLTTNAVVANRGPILKWSLSGPTMGSSAAVATVPAGSAGTFDWALGMPLSVALLPGINVAAMPLSLQLTAGGFFAIEANNMQAGDQWSAPIYTVREWLEAT